MHSLFTLLAIILQIPMADSFRSDGKIYVVIVVILIILIGLIVYLFRIERGLKKLEERIEEKE
jgi:uncharacterized membrane protein YqgA involved in biofilm formation